MCVCVCVCQVRLFGAGLPRLVHYVWMAVSAAMFGGFCLFNYSDVGLMQAAIKLLTFQ